MFCCELAPDRYRIEYLEGAGSLAPYGKVYAARPCENRLEAPQILMQKVK
jgi:hypothetical protein